jgi:hypothetical protein
MSRDRQSLMLRTGGQISFLEVKQSSPLYPVKVAITGTTSADRRINMPELTWSRPTPVRWARTYSRHGSPGLSAVIGPVAATNVA